MTSWMATSRPDLLAERGPQPFPMLAGQGLGHPNGRHHPVLLGRGQGDEALDGVGEGPLARRHRSSGQHDRRFGGPSGQQLTDQFLALGQPDRPIAQSVAQLGRGLHQPGEPEELVLGLLQGAVALGDHQLGPDGLSIEGRGEGLPPGPAHGRTFGHDVDGGLGHLAVEQSVDQPLPFRLGPTGVGHRPTQAGR